MATNKIARSVEGQKIKFEEAFIKIVTLSVFIIRPTNRRNMAQGLFYGGSGHWATAHTRPAFSKNTTVKCDVDIKTVCNEKYK